MKDTALARIRVLAATPGAVQIGGDSVASMGGRGVDGRDVQHALRNATAADSRGGPDLFVVGPTVDGEPLTVVARIDGDTLYVSNVTL